MQAKVSFTQKVKEELCTIEFSDIALRSLLSAFVKVNGVLSFRDGKKEIILRTENAKIAKMIYKAIGNDKTLKVVYTETIRKRGDLDG